MTFQLIDHKRVHDLIKELRNAKIAQEVNPFNGLKYFILNAHEQNRIANISNEIKTIAEKLWDAGIQPDEIVETFGKLVGPLHTNFRGQPKEAVEFGKKCLKVAKVLEAIADEKVKVDMDNKGKEQNQKTKMDILFEPKSTLKPPLQLELREEVANFVREGNVNVTVSKEESGEIKCKIKPKKLESLLSERKTFPESDMGLEKQQAGGGVSTLDESTKSEAAEVVGAVRGCFSLSCFSHKRPRPPSGQQNAI